VGISAFGASGIQPGVCTSTTRPTSPYTGQIIFETDTAQLRYWDGTIWNNALGSPVGSVQSFAGSTAPTGWLLCFGQAVSRTTYADLFTVLSTTYGTGDGSTTFNLPDMRGRVPAGKDDMGGSAASRLTSGTSGVAGATLGAVGGDQRVHQHTHVQNSHNHSQNAHAHGVYDPSHNHQQRSSNMSISNGGNDGLGYNHYGGNYASNLYTNYSGTGIGIYGETAINIAATATNQDFGAGASQNVQPTIVLNYIFKA